MSLQCRRVSTILGIVVVGSALALVATCAEPKTSQPPTPPESLYQPAGG